MNSEKYTLYKNANVQTVDKENPKAESFIVKDSKFLFVGSEEDSRKKLEGKEFDEINLESNLVLPGFNDSHLHFLHYAKGLLNVNLTGTRSIDELKTRLKEKLESRDKEDNFWLEGEGWNQDYFVDEKRFPTKEDLDEVSTEVPILIMRACFHIGVLNSKGLELLELNSSNASEYGDLIEVFPNGEPNGVIKENLLENVKSKKPGFDYDLTKDILLKAQEKAFEQGLTSVQSDDFGYVPNQDFNLLFDLFKDLYEEDKLKLRISEQCLFLNVKDEEKFFNEGYHYGWGNETYRISTVKILSDGSLGARTAALRNGYNDDSSTKGIMLFTQEELDEMVLLSHENKCPVAIHGIGDRAIEMALNSIEKAKKTYPDIKLRHGIVHCQITDEELLNRFKELEVMALVQPIFIDYDMNIVSDRVGENLSRTSYAWKTMKDKGINVSFGTDAPVEPFDTMPNIYSAVTRKNITGDEEKTYLEKEKMSMEDAIYAYTYESAYASGEEEIKGTISPGKLADFIVLDRDLFNLENDKEILDTKVLETYVGGQLVFKR